MERRKISTNCKWGGGNQQITQKIEELENLINQLNNKVESITKESLGLGNVDNTHDADKNVNSAIFLRTTEISEGTDLNNIIKFGFYSCSGSATAFTIVNSPTRIAFGLTVSANAPITQEITEFTIENPKKYFRTYYGYDNVWSPWYRIYTEADPQPNLL